MNTITLAKRYAALLDETYRECAKTAVLESDSALARQGANADEIVIPCLSMDGLADYSRNEGYVKGNVSLNWNTVKFTYERGRMFSVDNMDNEESQNIAFGSLAGEFVRTMAVPEIDAFRFASLAGTEDISTATGTLNSGEAAIGAIRKAAAEMDAAEVPSDNRILFVTPAVMGMIEDMDTIRSRAVLAGFEQIVCVPQSRFYTKISLADGVSEGQTEGGYSKAADGKKINFMIVHKPAVIQFTKHAVPKIVSPANNPDADAWKYGYRNYGICQVYPSKAAGIFCHHEA